MNRLHRIFTTLIIMLWAVMAAYAQEGMSIAGGLREMEKDLDARTESVRDQNNTLCALIKVYTTADNLTFDNGQLGIVRVEQKKKQSEWWVYVPEGTEKLKIAHPQYGQLNTGDGFIHFAPLKRATVYRLELRTPQMDALEQIDRDGYLILETQPDGAQVYLIRHGVEEYIGLTPIQKKLHYGNYVYRIVMPNYQNAEGVITIDAPTVHERKKMVSQLFAIQDNIAFGELNITTYPFYADVSIDGQNVGTTPMSYNLPVGEYEVVLSKQGFNTVSQHVNVVEDEITIHVDLQQEGSSTPYNASPKREIEQKTEPVKQEVEIEEVIEEVVEEVVEEESVKEVVEDAEEEKQKAERRAEQERRNIESGKNTSSPIHPRFEQMVLGDFSCDLTENTDNAFGISYIAGSRLSKNLFAGAGVGVMYDKNGGDYGNYYNLIDYKSSVYLTANKWQIPLFAHMRLYLAGGKPLQLFLGASVGCVFEPESNMMVYNKEEYVRDISFLVNSFFVAPGLGINIRTSSKFSLDISFSYYGKDAICYSDIEKFHYRWVSGIKLNLGFTF